MVDTQVETIPARELPRSGNGEGRTGANGSSSGRENGAGTPQTQERRDQARAKDLREGVGQGQNIELDLGDEEKKEVARILGQRKEKAENKWKLKPGEMTVVDRLARTLTPETLQKIAEGEVTKEVAAIASVLVHDELIALSLAAASVVRENPGKYGKIKSSWPIVGRWASKPTPTTTTEQTALKMMTDYAKECGFNGSLSQEQMDARLRRVHKIENEMTQKALGVDSMAPEYEYTSSSIHPESIARSTQNKLQIEINNALDDISKQKFNGESYDQIWQKDPVLATQVYNEAFQRAIFRLSPDLARNILDSETPGIRKESVDAHITRLEKKPKDEEANPLKETLDEKATEKTSIESRINQLDTLINGLEQQLPGLEQAFAGIKKKVETEKGLINDEIRDLDTQWSASLATLERYLAVPLPDKGKKDTYKDEYSRWNTNLTKAREETVRFHGELEAKRKELRTLLGQEAEAEIKKKTAEDQMKKYQRERSGKKRELIGVKADEKTAKIAYEAKLKEISEGGTPENREKADALRRWVQTTQNFNQVLDIRLNGGTVGDYSLEGLADTGETVDGEIKGAERIRELLFHKTGDKIYDPKEGRKMLSDETIARAIIWKFGLDTSMKIETSAGATSIREILDTIRNSREDIRTMAPGPTRDGLQISLTYTQRELVEGLLGNLKGSQFRTTDLLQFIVQQGAKSAENGNPYLDLSGLEEQFTRTEAEIRPVGVETLPPPEVGATTIKGNELTWEGDTRTMWLDGKAHRLHLKATETSSRADVGYKIEVEATPELVSALPPTQTEALDLGIDWSIIDVFYGKDGLLRTEYARRDRHWWEREKKIPTWIQIDNGREETTLSAGVIPTAELATDKVSDDISRRTIGRGRRSLGLEIIHNMNIATGDTIASMTPNERLALLGGRFQPTEARSIPETGSPGVFKDYTITLGSDGNFYILETGAPTEERKRLDQFFQSRSEKYREVQGTQILSSEERKKLQQELGEIRMLIGREVRRAQQRR
ncbi:hypothetical protein C4577_07850 [Candidatus Parcubacteria bacterium]|nr:MAG: hypothetical protein C4577_07850 [Candidatus Parcubacteria bacterium]